MTWPASEPSKSDFKVWIKFISHILNARSILSHTLSLQKHPYLAVTSEIKKRQFDIPNKGWVDESVVFSKHLDFLNLLLASKLEFVVNSSFYPTKSHLISAAWFASIGRQLVAKATFITSVVEEFQHPFSAELCGALSIMTCIDSILTRYPHPNIEFIVRIGSDCSSVLDTLWISSPVITMSKHLH